MKPILAFLSICIMGFFCAYIGGTKPFTEAAGVVAFGTLLMATIGALLAWAYEEWFQ